LIRRLISRIRRRLDRRNQGTHITPYQWKLLQNSIDYRESHYWQINRGNG